MTATCACGQASITVNALPTMHGCGTTLFRYVSALPTKIGIAGGCFADDALPVPACSVTDQRREPWLRLPSSWKVYAD